MKSRAVVVAVISCALIVPLAYAISVTRAEEAQAVTAVDAWEHLALQHDSPGLRGDLSRKINRLGDQGWQLVCVTPIADKGSTVKTVYYFIRPK